MTLAMGPLIQTSIRDPQTAARSVMAIGLSRSALWHALALVAILNTALILLVTQLSAPALPLPALFSQPLALFFLVAGLTVVYVHAIFWAGLAIGGQGTLDDVLAVVVWFQILRAMAQIAVILVSLALPPLGGLMSLAVAIWGFWIFLNFIATALNLRSPWHALVVLVISFAGLLMGFGILMALVGGLVPGGSI